MTDASTSPESAHRGTCDGAMEQGLRRWPGAERLFGDGEVHLVRRGINHVKVVVERGARPEAKAYVGMDVRPYRREGESG